MACAKYLAELIFHKMGEAEGLLGSDKSLKDNCQRWLCTSTKPDRTIFPVASIVSPPVCSLGSIPLLIALMVLPMKSRSLFSKSPKGPSPTEGSILMMRVAFRMRTGEGSPKANWGRALTEEVRKKVREKMRRKDFMCLTWKMRSGKGGFLTLCSETLRYQKWVVLTTAGDIREFPLREGERFKG